MHICYNKLWHILLDRNMNREDLRKLTGISSASIAKLGKGQNITTDVLVRICEAMSCDITEIMELSKSDEAKQESVEKPFTRSNKRR